MNWARFLETMPLVAILRGLTPSDAVPIATALYEAGFVCLEVPLNSPEPFASIAAIRAAFDEALFVGAGTVLSVHEVSQAAAAKAQFIVSPNTNAAVIESTKAHGLHTMPGFLTATEAFAAVEAGADALKLFPAESTSPAHLAALKAVLPRQLPVFAVGGVTEATMSDWIGAGAAGFGVGGALYRPGDAPGAVGERAEKLVAAFRRKRT